MKTIKTLAASAAMLTLLAGCQREIISESISRVSEITAYDGESQTRTVLANDGTSILWSPADEISVFYNEDGVKFTSINKVPKSPVVFASSQAIIYGTSETDADAYLYAIYPYSSDNAQTGSQLTLTVPSTQTAVAGSFARGVFPSIGRSKTTNMPFYNVCGGLRFSLTQSGIKKIVFTANGGKTIAGKVSVGFDGEQKPQLSSVISGESSVTLVAPGSGEFETSKWYYISLLPTVLESGFSMTFIKRNDEFERATLEVSSSKEIKRSVFGEVSEIDKGLTFKVGVAGISLDKTGMILAPMTAGQLTAAISPSDAEYDWIKWESSDKTIASVDDDGLVLGKKAGTCVITVSTDNGSSASCSVYVASAPAVTSDASDVSYFTATLNGSVSVTSSSSFSKTASFLYSSTASTLEGLKTSGTKVSATLSGDDFSKDITGLTPSTKYYFVAVVTAFGKDYYGEVKNFTTSSFPQPQSVNLGLSVKWASFNIGASKPEEYGRYFAWGDVTGQTWNGSSWSGSGFSSYPTYKVDSNNNLKPAYDAAHVILGGTWRMPTKAECQELIDNCTCTWTTNYNGTGVKGRIFTSKKTGYTDKSIFFPAAGYGDGTNRSNAGSVGRYWSSTLGADSTDDAYHLYFNSSNVNPEIRNFRCRGFSVRPVTE